MTIFEFGRGMRQYFGVDPNKFILKGLRIVTGRVMLDICAFGDWLQENPKYDQNDSIRNNIINIYGQEAANFIEQTL